MKAIARIILWSRMLKFYKDGSVFGFVWNWFNPLSWIFSPIMFLTGIFLYGMLETWKYRYQLGFGMNPYFKEHPEKLVWIKRTKL